MMLIAIMIVGMRDGVNIERTTMIVTIGRCHFPPITPASTPNIFENDSDSDDNGDNNYDDDYDAGDMMMLKLLRQKTTKALMMMLIAIMIGC